jgi:hypothetical protein
VRAVYYTEKTVAQAVSALNERLGSRGGSRGVQGWAEKNGRFAISMTTTVAGRFSRTTQLSGKITRENGVTVCDVAVASGVAPRGRIAVFGLMGAVAVLLILAGSPLMAAAVVPLAALLYIPMKGDYENSAALLADVQRTLKARTTPPKPAAKAPAKSSPARSTTSRPAKSMFDD